MIRIKYKLDKDQYGGIGLFADQGIAEGELVYEFRKEFINIFTKEMIDTFPDNVKKTLRKYIYGGLGALELDNAYYYCTDDSRFMNHSYTPSTIPDSDGNYYAVKPLKAGDELTCNYADFDREFAERGFDSFE